eukprot:CAMPEP_0177251722 /NCGR_PEP_ID=MMETSP0367-20130122/54130_1 /TAXON_ID=447022 ORGANISM="Scrippsiella hangoei-like, Strain SHHI-4" /NCGR_SAMPLE_ID=MMETSP0367 /ASSEMBLY_ACC=CAM_ASM_000362 /LENGTH=68 /DNA_ID=CAMNT_0018704699 /DNA_START=74 /DNA_END=280 /DNA_ORIENTATION=-
MQRTSNARSGSCQSNLRRRSVLGRVCEPEDHSCEQRASELPQRQGQEAPQGQGLGGDPDGDGRVQQAP